MRPTSKIKGRCHTLITPSALNVLIIGFSMVIFSFLWRMAAAKLSEGGSVIGDAMGVIL
jgi:hypothetical protein